MDPGVSVPRETWIGVSGGGVRAGASRARCEHHRVGTTELYRRGLAGWPSCFPVAQAPNAPLLVALAGHAIAAVAGHRRRSRDAGEAVFVLGLTVWAWEEATTGVNWFRRLLGVAGLSAVVARGVGALVPGHERVHAG